MKLLLNESIPRQLSVLSPNSFEIRTVLRMGWAGSEESTLGAFVIGNELRDVVIPHGKQEQ